jgi:hypothetical protein
MYYVYNINTGKILGSFRELKLAKKLANEDFGNRTITDLSDKNFDDIQKVNSSELFNWIQAFSEEVGFVLVNKENYKKGFKKARTKFRKRFREAGIENCFNWDDTK